MECQRLNKMIRAWYIQVQDETLAPARMVEFMEDHVENCDECLMDLGIDEEIKKITAIVLPPSKMTKPPKRAKTEDVVMPKFKGADDDDDDDSDDTDDDSDDDDDDDDDIEVDDDVEVDDDDVEPADDDVD